MEGIMMRLVIGYAPAIVRVKHVGLYGVEVKSQPGVRNGYASRGVVAGLAGGQALDAMQERSDCMDLRVDRNLRLVVLAEDLEPVVRLPEGQEVFGDGAMHIDPPALNDYERRFAAAILAVMQSMRQWGLILKVVPRGSKALMLNQLILAARPLLLVTNEATQMGVEQWLLVDAFRNQHTNLFEVITNTLLDHRYGALSNGQRTSYATMVASISATSDRIKAAVAERARAEEVRARQKEALRFDLQDECRRHFIMERNLGVLVAALKGIKDRPEKQQITMYADAKGNLVRERRDCFVQVIVFVQEGGTIHLTPIDGSSQASENLNLARIEYNRRVREQQQDHS